MKQQVDPAFLTTDVPSVIIKQMVNIGQYSHSYRFDSSNGRPCDAPYPCSDPRRYRRMTYGAQGIALKEDDLGL